MSRWGTILPREFPFVIERDGVSKTLTVVPDQTGSIPKIGVLSPRSTTLDRRGLPTAPGTAAAQAEPPFESGDKIVAIDGHPVANYAQIEARLAENPDKPLKVTVERSVQKAGKELAKEEQPGAAGGHTRSADDRRGPGAHPPVRPGNGNGSDHGHPGQFAGRHGWLAHRRLDRDDRWPAGRRSHVIARTAPPP